MNTEEVVAAMLTAVEELPPVNLPLAECRDCILASAVVPSANMPAWPTASRDGFAVRSADVALTCGSHPVSLAVAGAIAPDQHGGGSLAAGFALRIVTGASLPAGADAVVPCEDTTSQNGGTSGGTIEIGSPIKSDQFVASVGSEFAAGATALRAGLLLGPPELAALSALGHTHALIIPKPRVAVVVTGSELRRHLADSDMSKLHASNGLLVTAMVHACDAMVESLRIVSDDIDELAHALRCAMSADIIVTTGGTGRGSGDLMSRVLNDQEVQTMWNMKVRGSRPATFRLLRDKPGHRVIPHLALPGRPVAAMVAFSLFAYPLLRRLSGHPPLGARYISARLVVAPGNASSRQRFFPVSLRYGAGGWEATPTGDAALYGLAAAVGAHGFAILGHDGDEPEVGQLTRVLLPPWRPLPTGMPDQA